MTIGKRVIKPKRQKLELDRLIAADYPLPEDMLCVEILIPNDLKYLYALQGFYAQMTNAWAWEGTTEDRKARAMLVLLAYTATDWEQCMNCEQLQECLQPLFDALRAQVKQDVLLSQYGTENPVGVPLPPEVTGAPLAAGSNPTCNLDIVWSQAEQLVDYSNTMITDTLEQVETATNNVELAQVITSLPILDELGADAIAGYIEVLLDGIAENYAAEFDLAYRNGLACDIFCSAKGDCEITIDKVYEILLARVTAHFGSPGETIGTIFNLLTYLVDQDIDGTVVVDTMMFLLWGGAKLINTFIQDVGTTALETIMELAVNDANNDWEILCECPEEATEPIIDPAPCSDPASSDGTNIEHLGGTRWRVTSTANFTDAGVGIKDINGAAFMVDNVAFPDTTNVSAAWSPAGAGCTFGSVVPELTPLDGALWTWQDEDVGARVEFDFLPV